MRYDYLDKSAYNKTLERKKELEKLLRGMDETSDKFGVVLSSWEETLKDLDYLKVAKREG